MQLLLYLSMILIDKNDITSITLWYIEYNIAKSHAKYGMALYIYSIDRVCVLYLGIEYNDQREKVRTEISQFSNPAVLWF